MHIARLNGRKSLKSLTIALLLGASTFVLTPTESKAQDIIGGLIGHALSGGGGYGGGYRYSGRHRHYSSHRESRHASRSRRHRGGDDEDSSSSSGRSAERSSDRSGERSADRSGGERPTQDNGPVVATGAKAPSKSSADEPVLGPSR